MTESRFELLFQQAPIAYQALDLEGRLLEVNRAWCDLFDCSQQEIIGRPFEDLIVPEDREHYRECFSHFKTSGETHDAVFRVLPKDGAPPDDFGGRCNCI